MLPRSQRLSVQQFNSVMEKGRAHHSSLFILRACNGEKNSRIAASVPNKIAKKATERNRMRREMYEVIRPLYSNIKAGQYIVVFAKSAATSASRGVMEKEMKEIFVKAGLLR